MAVMHYFVTVRTTMPKDGSPCKAYVAQRNPNGCFGSILLKNSIARAIGRAYKADDLAAFAIFSIGTGY